MLRRLTFTLALCLASCLGCSDAPSSPDLTDRPRLSLPLQVYPGQLFGIDASRSSLGEEAIRGYAFDLGDGSGPLVVRDPGVLHQYETPGDYTVRLRLWNGVSIDHAPITVVSCFQHLRCGPLPDRPCPPGYACAPEEGLCAPTQVDCLADDDCPADLRCLHGACGAGGLCSDQGPFDPPPPIDIPCADHDDCPTTDFCVAGVCSPSDCDDACVESVLSSFSLAPSPPEAVAGRFSGIDGGDTRPLDLLTTDGVIWRAVGDVQDIPAPEGAPPVFSGALTLIQALSPFQDNPERRWLGLDVAPGDDLLPFRALSTGVRLNDDEGLLGDMPRARIDLHASPLSDPAPETFFGELAQVGESLLASTGPDGVLITYALETGDIKALRGDSFEDLGRYTPGDGVAICGMATDGGRLFLSENRTDANGEATVSRVGVVPLQGGSARYLALPQRGACGLAFDVNAGALTILGFGATPYLVTIQVD